MRNLRFEDIAEILGPLGGFFIGMISGTLACMCVNDENMRPSAKVVGVWVLFLVGFFGIPIQQVDARINRNIQRGYIGGFLAGFFLQSNPSPRYDSLLSQENKPLDNATLKHDL